MDSESVKQMKKLFTEMFNDRYKNMSGMYSGLEKSISEMIEANNKLTNQKLGYRSKYDQIQIVSNDFCRKPRT